MAEIRETGFLKVLADISFPEKKVVINPNDGFDIGLMMTDATVQLYYGYDPSTLPADDDAVKPVFGNIYQKNECTLGTIELSAKVLETIGNPKKVRLHLVAADPYPKVLVSGG